MHSECLTGDAFGSLRCDCRPQLEAALARIEREGQGVVVYLRQEGRGIGLINKLKAYSLQDGGLDTVEANEKLGFPADLRNYGVGAQILTDLGIHRLRLLTNNPRKIAGLGGYGLQVVERVPLEINAGDHNADYLAAKRDKLGHLFWDATPCCVLALAVEADIQDLPSLKEKAEQTAQRHGFDPEALHAPRILALWGGRSLSGNCRQRKGIQRLLSGTWRTGLWCAASAGCGHHLNRWPCIQPRHT